MTSGAEPGPQAPQSSPSIARRWNFGDLGVRLASAIVMVALALGALWLGGWAFALFWGAAGFAVFWEWQRLVGGPAMPARLAIGATVAVGLGVMGSAGGADFAVALIVVAVLCVGWLAGRERALWAGAGVVYAGALVLAVCLLRNSLFHGTTALLWLFAVVWGTDIMAYFGGRLIGGPKLWPRVSPGKTWSGFIIGVTCGALAGVGAVVLSTISGEVSLAPLLPLGLAAAAVSQAGDLFESAVKRRFDVKDASHLIPGHGGAMDRLDGFIFAAVFAALVGTAHSGFVAAAHGLLVW